MEHVLFYVLCKQYNDNALNKIINQFTCVNYRGGSLSALDLTCLGGTVDPGGLLLNGERVIQVPTSVTITSNVSEVVGNLYRKNNLEIQEYYVRLAQSKEQDGWSASPPINKKVCF